MPAPTTETDALNGAAAASTPFFIVGTGCCGSTLLRILLNRHPALAVPDETHFFIHLDPVAIGLPDPLTPDHADRYLDAFREASMLDPVCVTCEMADALEPRLRSGPIGAAELFRWVLDACTGPRGAGVRVGEKTPHHWREIDRIHAVFPGAPVIHIYRDPRDVLASFFSRSWWWIDSTWRSARYWKRALARAIEADARLGATHMLLRYEDLATDTRPALERVCRFLGVEPVETMLTPGHEPALYKGQQRLDADPRTDPTGPIVRSRVGTYRDKLTPFQIRLIERTIGADMLSALGYEPDRHVPRPPWAGLEYPTVRVHDRLARLGASITKRLPQPRAANSTSAGASST